jgi:two-component system sensor histidine kinase BaeS
LIDRRENKFEKIFNDKNRIQRVIVNLISNSIKFTQRGGKVDVILKDSKTNNSVLKIKVIDTGEGMT